MRKLFGEGPARPPTDEVVKQLSGFGYKAERVAKWTSEKADTVLMAVKKESLIAVNRAAEKARTEDRPTLPTKQGRLPIPVMRLAAATYIEQCTGHLELAEAVMYSTMELDNGELKRLARYLVKLFRDNDGRCPDLIQHAAEETGGARGAVGTGPDDQPAQAGGSQESGTAG